MAANCTVGTLAGSTQGYANGTGTAAQFHNPGGMCEYGGDLLVCDTDNHVIRRVTPAGVVSLFAGGPGLFGDADGTLLTVRFRNPSDIAVSPLDGHIYVLCENQDAITGGARIVELDEGANTATTFVRVQDAPSPNAFSFGVDSAGNLYFNDFSNSVVWKVTTAGVASVWVGLRGTPGDLDGTGGAARLWSPQGIAVDDNDNVYVGDNNNEKIYKITSAAAMTTIVSTGLADVPNSLEWHAGRIYATVPNSRWIVSWADNGTGRLLEAGDTTWACGSGTCDGPALEATFDFPWGIERWGGLFAISDAASMRIRTYQCRGGRPRMRGRHVPTAVRIRGREKGVPPSVPRMRGRQAT